MRQAPDTELIVNIAHTIVAQVHPDELFLFPSISARYKHHPNQIRKQFTANDDPLSFGLGDVNNLITPVILLIVQQTIVQIGADVTEQSTKGLFHFLRKKTGKRSPSNKPTGQPMLPTYTLDEIKDKAYHTALEFNLSDKNAHRIANALVGELITMKKKAESSNE